MRSWQHRHQASVSPLGFTTTNLFDAVNQPIAVVDALGNRTSSVFDAIGRVSAQQNGLGFLTSFVFDAASQQIAVIDANSHATSNLYDLRGSVLSTQDSLGAFTSMAFDAVGNTILRTDARNWPSTYTLDALNRTVGTLYVNATRVTNTFDAAGQQLTMQDLTGITNYAYDLAGRQISVAYPTGKTLTYTLDPVGNRTLLTDPDSLLTSYSWDSQNRMIQMTSPYADLTTVTYDALDRERTKTLGCGLKVSHTYDADGRETVWGNYLAAAGASAIYTAAYDAIGNRLTVLEIDKTQVTFAYDASYQLLNEQRSGVYAYNTSYAYDSVGNRTLKNDSGALSTYAYNPGNEQVLLTPPTGQPTTSSYDPNGNLTLENVGGTFNTYTWDSENRLLVAQVSGTNTRSNTYSADGLRQSQLNGPNLTYYTWDGQNVLQEAQNSLVTTLAYVQSPGVWGGLVREYSASGQQYFGFDFTGSTRLFVRPDGTVADNYNYKAFGEELPVGSGSVPHYRYGGAWGYYRDISTRLYVEARHLRTDLGRWMSRDPIGFYGGDWNLYRYAGNDPVQRVDPDGLEWRWDGPWVRANQGLIHNCISQGLQSPDCQGLNSNAVSKMMRCIIGCETDNVNPKRVMRDDAGNYMPIVDEHGRYKGYGPPPPPVGGVGPCRLTTFPLGGQFVYPDPRWSTDPCANIKSGIALLCHDIQNAKKSYHLPGDWAGDAQGTDCYDRCMGKKPKPRHGKRR